MSSGLQASLKDGIYYFNNKNYGKYLHKNETSSALNAASGLISSLGDTIRWKISHLGNKEYTIQSADDPAKYLYGSSSGSVYLGTYPSDSSGTVASAYRWKISGSAIGGMLIQNVMTERYLYQNGASTVGIIGNTGTAGTSAYNQRVWRAASTDYYGNNKPNNIDYRNELSATTSILNMEISANSSQNIIINTYYLYELWDTPSDFTYSINNSELISYNDLKMVSREILGGTQVTATHKPTGRVKNFYVLVGFSSTIIETPLADHISEGLNEPYNVWPANSESIYYNVSDYVRTSELNVIKENAYLICVGGVLKNYPNAAVALSHYLDNTGTPYVIDMKTIIKEWGTANNFRAQDINSLISAVEASASYSQKTLKSISAIHHNLMESSDGGYTIGSYTTHLSCTYKKTSPTAYSMDVIYELHDVYNWDKKIVQMGSLPLSPKELWELHHGGVAKNFEIYGTNSFTLTWSTGQTFQNGAVISDET